MKQEIFECARKQVVEQGAHQFSVGEIAKLAKVDLIEVYELYPTIDSLMVSVIEEIHLQSIKSISISDLEESPRDLLIEIVMNRFEIMANYRKFLQITHNWLLTSINLKIARNLIKQTSDLIRLCGYNNGKYQTYVSASVLFTLQIKLVNEWLFDETLTDDSLLAKVDQIISKWEATTSWII